MDTLTSPTQALQNIVEQQLSGTLVARSTTAVSEAWRIYFSHGKFHFATVTLGQKERLAYLLCVKQGLDFDTATWDDHPSDYEYLLHLWQSGAMPARSLRQAIAACLQETLVQYLAAPQVSLEFERQIDLESLAISAPLPDLLAPVKAEIEQWTQLHPEIDSPLQRLGVEDLDRFYAQELPKSRHPDFIRSLGQLLVENVCLYELANRLSVDVLKLARGLQPLARSRSIRVSPYLSSSKAPPSGDPRDRPLIACIDDSQTVQRQVKGILDASGYQVLAIAEPTRSLTLLARHRPELILLDITMPEVDGYEICRMLNQSVLLQDIPIVMLTGRAGTFDRMRARLAGAKDYLTKPFDPQALVAVVEKLRQRRSS